MSDREEYATDMEDEHKDEGGSEAGAGNRGQPIGPLNGTFSQGKDMSSAQLVETWGGTSRDMPVLAYFTRLEYAAELGQWSEREKLGVLNLKLRDDALLFVSSLGELDEAISSYQGLKHALIERFGDRKPAQYRYAQLQSAEQRVSESIREFADRCRTLARRTIPVTTDPVAAKVLGEEADRRMLAAFVNGLRGNVGRQVRYSAPLTFAKAVQQAQVVEMADKGASIREGIRGEREIRSRPVFVGKPTCVRCSGHALVENLFSRGDTLVACCCHHREKFYPTPTV